MPAVPTATRRRRAPEASGSGLIGTMLLTAVLTSGRGNILETFDDTFFTEDELPFYRYVTQHRARYRRLPALETAMEQGFNVQATLREDPAYYATRLRERSVFDAVATSNATLLQAMEARDVEGIVAAINQMHSQVNHRVRPVVYSTLGQELGRLQQWYHLAKYRPDEVAGIPWPWESLNRVTFGRMPGDLTTLVARPGVGKSWLLKRMLKAARDAGFRICLISMEMTLEQMAARWFGLETGINPRAIRMGQLDHWAEQTFHQVVHDMEHDTTVHMVSGDSKRSTDDVLKIISEIDPDEVMIDAAYLMNSSATKAGKTKKVAKWERIADSMQDFKGIALETHRPITQTVQFNREVKAKNRGTNLDVGSIGGTDEIGQLSSMVVGAVEGDEPYQRSRRNLFLMKNREGEQCALTTSFTFAPVSIEEIWESQNETGLDGSQVVDNEDVTSWMN